MHGTATAAFADMVRRTVLLTSLLLAPAVAHASHDRPTVDWHDTSGHAWSPYATGGQYVLAGGSGRKWQVDFTALRAEEEISRGDAIDSDGEQKQFDATGKATIVGLDARRGDTQLYQSADGDVTWTASGVARATVGADVQSGGRIVHDANGGITPLDFSGGGFVGAKLECEIDSRLVVCGLVIGSKSGLQGGLGFGAYDSSPIGFDPAHQSVTLRLSPSNVFPGEGQTLDITVDASKFLADGEYSGPCVRRHLQPLIRGVDMVENAFAKAWAFLNDEGPRGNPVTVGFGDNIGRFAETRPRSDETSPAANEGFNHGSNWTAR